MRWINLHNWPPSIVLILYNYISFENIHVRRRKLLPKNEQNALTCQRWVPPSSLPTGIVRIQCHRNWLRSHNANKSVRNIFEFWNWVLSRPFIRALSFFGSQSLIFACFRCHHSVFIAHFYQFPSNTDLETWSLGYQHHFCIQNWEMFTPVFSHRMPRSPMCRCHQK